MIAAILIDLLEEAGYLAEQVTSFSEAQQTLAHDPPAFLLVDRGMVKPELEPEWLALDEMAQTIEVPLLLFSCSPLPGVNQDLILRSPSDFATVVEKVTQELRTRPPFLGMTLLHMGLLQMEELEAALRIQKELSKISRRYPLGELLVRLGFIDEESLEQALKKQEP
jgi:hypothetical protein